MIRHRFRPVSGASVQLLAALAVVLACVGQAFALPQTPVVAGISSGTNPTFNTVGSSLTVTQNSPRAVIDWTSFSIANGESVTFTQPTKGSIAFNVVTGGSVSNISGSLTANGGVWLFSPAGIIFGSGSTVNTGSFLASTGIFNSTSLNEALNDNAIQIFAQATPGQGSITVDAASMSLPAASINANAGFVLLHSPTVTQAGDVTATDAVVYNADEDIASNGGVTVSPGASGIALVDEESFSGTPSASHIDHTGTTTAGTWFEADAAEDVTTEPGFGGIINLSGHVSASGMKDSGNPDDQTNGYSVILDGDSAGNNTTGEVTTIDASAGTINASQGIYATAGTIKTGLWANTGGEINVTGGDTGGVEVDQPLVSTSPGFVLLAGANSLDINADVTTAGSALLASAGPLQVASNVTIQAGASVGGSSLTLFSTGAVTAAPTSTLLVGPSLAAPNGALNVSAGGTLTPGAFPQLNIDNTYVGQGGDLTLGTAVAGSMALQATTVNNIGGGINIPGAIHAPGEISLNAMGAANVAGSITSGGSVYINASELDLGPNGGIAAGFAGAGVAPAGTLSTGSGAVNLTVQESAEAGLVPVAQAPAAGDIAIGAPIFWDNPNALTLDAFHSIAVSGAITDAGTAQVVLKTNDGGTGGDYAFVNGGSLDFSNTPGGGQGLTIDGQPYTLVYSQADLLNINNNLGGFYALAGPLDLFGPGDLTPTVFSAAPIASLVSQPFTGTFTGLGNTISNLSILANTPIVQLFPTGYATTGAVGLFGFVGTGGVVRDINLANAGVFANANGMQAGALVGVLLGTVKNASSSGGEVDAANGLTTAQGYADAEAGGLVGSSDGTILNSSSSAFVVAGDGFAGGLVGVAFQGGAIAGSSASGNVIVGSYSGNTADPVPYAGGLVGLIYGYQFGGVNPILVNVSGSFATGAVSGGSGSTVGGFVGLVDEGQVSTSYATGSVTQTAAPVIFSPTNFPGNFAGGFAGLVFTGGSVTQSYASGAVTTVGPAAGASPTTPGSFAGGFVGDLDSGGSVSDSYSLGSVTATGGAGNIDGGFVGLIQGAATANAVYATGFVSSTGLSAGLVGLLGNATDTASPTGFISNSYWDEGTTGKTVGVNISPSSGAMATNITGLGGGTGLSPYDPANYANFDLSGTWYMIAGDTRPILRSEYSTTITNAHQLQLMALDLSADYTLASDIDASETASASGVWNPASGFVPVGANGSADFTGTLDGAGHTVSNLFIDYSTIVPQMGPANFPTNGYGGLFGVIGAGGVVQDINLANANVTGADKMWVGALAGSSIGAVDHATSSGFVTAGATDNTTTPQTFAIAGGLIGVDGLDGTISNSSSSATVAGGANGSIVGGLVGSLNGGGSISNSFATGDVSLGSSTTALDGEAGGLVGSLYGYTSPNNANPVPVSITGSYATGAVSSGAEASIGGFAGIINNGQVVTSYATGPVTQTASGAMEDNLAGGFAGLIDFDSKVGQSWSSGAVSIVGGTDSSHYAFGGGFAGGVEDSASVEGAYSLGSVTATGSNFSITGGFAGLVQNSGAEMQNTTVDSAYATGLVTGSGIVGGFVGLVGAGGQVSNSYWDQATTGHTTGFNLTGGGMASNVLPVGGSGPNPYQPASYANFDLTDWFIIPGETRPILKSEYSTTITNAHQLQLMDLNLSGQYTLANNIDASETTNPAGVWNPANGFVPVGATAAAPFTGKFNGKFNGQGPTISNLTIVDTTPVQQLVAGTPTNGAVGLFGFVGSHGIVENVNLANATVTGGNGMSVGALVGDLELGGGVGSGFSSGSVTGGSGVNTVSDGFANANVGGLIGAAASLVAFSSSSATVVGAQANAGGLVGVLQGSPGIFQSSATGIVSVGSNADNQTPIVGGLVGSVQSGQAEIIGSYSTSTVTAGAASFAGGFVGLLSGGSISDSYATGSVTQTAGGLTGITNIGGGDDVIGGFTGAVLVNGTIIQSFSTGPVTTIGGPDAAHSSFAGGFVGDLDSGSSATNAYSQGSVTTTGAASNVDGGFAGIIVGAASASEVYATGLVNGTGTTAELVGLLGDAYDIQTPTSGFLTNAYWDEGTTGQTVGYNLSGAGSATNVVGMGGSTGIDQFTAATYVGFDFTNTWSVPSASPNFYPELLGVSHVLEVTANNVSSVYGTFPIYTLSVAGLQGGDSPFIIQAAGTSILAVGPLTNSTSGFDNVGSFALEQSGPLTAVGSTGAYQVVFDPGTLTVTPKPITGVLSGTVEKTYDGTTAANLAPGNFSLSGVVLNDQVSLTGPGSATYDNKNAGTGKTVTVNGVALSGADEADYTLEDPSASGAVGIIDPASITLSATPDLKVYDGTTNSSQAPTASQLFGTDSLVATQSYTSKDVLGTNQSTLAINPGYSINDGNGGANYTITNVYTAPGTITPASLLIDATGDSKVYDGTTVSTAAPTIDDSTQVFEGDSVTGLTQAFASKDVLGANNSVLNVTGYTVNDGNGGNDYTVTVASAAGTITPASLLIDATGNSKVYDGTTVSSATPTIDDSTQVFGNDSVTGLTQAFASKDVLGTNGSTLNVTGYTVNDGDGGNDYTVTTAPAEGTITPASITLSATGDIKVYDGTTNSSQAPTASQLFSNDSLVATQSFTSKNVLGTNESTLAINEGYSINDGNGGADYTITNVFTAPGTITPLALTASLTGTVTKTYDGSTSATLSGPTPTDPTGNYVLSGVIGKDDVSLNDPISGTYDNKNAGIGKVVTVTGLQISGDDANNYTVNGTAAGAVGIITPAALTLTAVTDTKTYDGGVSSSGTPTNSPLVKGDSLSNVVQTFGSKNVLGAGGSTLSVTGYTINDGNDGQNYTVTLVTAPGTINPAPLTIAAVTEEKTYDGTTVATVTPDPTGLVGGDTLVASEAFDSKNAGARTLAVAGYTISDGNNGGNYVVTTTTAPGTIDPKALTVQLVGSVSKPFDGNADATLTSNNYSPLSGVITGDNASLNDPTSGQYDSPTAGTNKLVTVTGLALSGDDAANYTVNGTAAAPIGTITETPQPITVVSPVVVVATSDFDDTAAAAGPAAAAAAAGSSSSGGGSKSSTTVVNVFPVAQGDPNQTAQGDSSPTMGAGNRDLWTGADESNQTCLPNEPCPPGAGAKP